jgi:hypothetical protein
MLARSTVISAKFVKSLQPTSVYAVRSMGLNAHQCSNHSVPLSFNSPTSKKWWEEVSTSNVHQRQESEVSRATHAIMQSIKKQSTNESLMNYVGLPSLEASEFVLLCLHSWIVCNHLRSLGERGKAITKSLTDKFWKDERVKSALFRERSARRDPLSCDKRGFYYDFSSKLDKALRENSELLFKETIVKTVFPDEPTLENANRLFYYVVQEMSALGSKDIEVLTQGHQDEVFSRAAHL